jgi:hypothetical protein
MSMRLAPFFLTARTRGQKHIGRLEIAMDNAAFVRRLYRPGENRDKLRRLISALRSGADSLLQVPPSDEFHREIGVAIMVTHFEYLNQIGMLQSGDAFDLGLEACAR